jgi:hypothetical protein
MEPETNTDQKDLAKQLVTYADAITGFAFVQSVAFGFAPGQTDFRASVLRGRYWVLFVLLFAYGFYWFFVMSVVWERPLCSFDLQTLI